MDLKRFALASVAGVLTACSLLIDTAGLSGTGPSADAAAPDGGSAPDGGGSTPVSDSDAGTDAGFCERHADALFCEDFDGPPVDPGAIVAHGGGNVDVVPISGAPSQPNALRAQVGTLDAGATANAYFLSPPFAVETKLHAAFDVAVVNGDHVIAFQLDQGGGAVYLSELIGDPSFLLYQEFAQYSDGGGATPFKWAPPITLGPDWHHADVCFDFVEHARTVVVDGHHMTGTGLSGWTGSAPLELGVAYVAGAAAAQEVHLDNLLVDSTDCP